MKALTVIFVLMATTVATAQPRLTLRTGFGTYAMKGMKNFQSELKNQFDSPVKSTSAFPGFIYFEGSFTIPVARRLNIGHDFAYGSTGGRLHYSDYSGEEGCDQIMNFSSFGTHVSYRLPNSNPKILIELSLTASYLITDLHLKFYRRVGDAGSNERRSFESINGSVQPEVIVTRKFGRFAIHAIAGYNISAFKGKFYVRSSDSIYLETTEGKPVRAEWDGVRLAFGINYFFKGMDWWKEKP